MAAPRVNKGKVSIVALAGAIATFIIGGMQHWWGLTVFPGLEGALVTIVSAALSLLIPDHKEMP